MVFQFTIAWSQWDGFNWRWDKMGHIWTDQGPTKKVWKYLRSPTFSGPCLREKIKNLMPDHSVPKMEPRIWGNCLSNPPNEAQNIEFLHTWTFQLFGHIRYIDQRQSIVLYRRHQNVWICLIYNGILFLIHIFLCEETYNHTWYGINCQVEHGDKFQFPLVYRVPKMCFFVSFVKFIIQLGNFKWSYLTHLKT